MKFLLAKKLGMSQIFNEDGKVVPVTLVKSAPSYILQIKSKERDGYGAVVVAADIKKGKEGKRQSDFKKIAEFRSKDNENLDFEAEKEINAGLFSKNEKVKITGISKGKGFQGVVKRHGFKGGPATHGHKHNLRQPGSIGSTFPMRVPKGRRMAGRMGSDQVSLRNVKIADVMPQEGIIALKGAVPGRYGSWVKIVKN